MDNLFSSNFYNEADQNVTLRRIRKALQHRLVQQFPDKDNDWILEKTEHILNVNGLDLSHFNFVQQAEQLITERLNDVSVDDNSNKNEKTIAGIFSEIANPIKKAVGYDYLYRTMKELYGKREAKRLSSLMYDYSIGLSDSTNILIPYCYALDASKLVTEGRDFGQLKSKPAKRISSYISALCETIHQMSSHFAGAIAVGTFFFDIAHILLVKQSENLDYFNDKMKLKSLENEFQQFVHSVNHLSRSGAESPFTNISIFDYSKIKHLVENDLSWYFDSIEDKHLVINMILELQKQFLDFFDKGDPLSNGMPYRFPVVTVNMSKVKTENGWELEDKQTLDEIVHRDIYRYNIFTSEGTKVASCCRMINESEALELAAQSNSFGAGAVGNLGSHRVATINFNRIALTTDTYEEYFKQLDKRMEDTKKILKAHKILIKKLASHGLQMFISNGWVALSRLFSTFGVMGLYEAKILMESKVGPFKSDFIEYTLKRLNDFVIKSTKENEGFIYNIEQIPGESYAVRLCKVDKELFGEDEISQELYANQWVPLWEDATIWEKFEADGKYNQMLTGGGIVHATIGEKVTPIQAKKLIEYAVKCGCEHFALNGIFSKCVNGHVTFGDVDICPICSEKINTKLTRIVGFLTPVQCWNKTRREWEFPRRTKVKID